MHRMTKSAALAAILGLAAITGAQAFEVDNSIETGQITLQDVTSDVNIWVKAVDTKIDASSVAVANSVSADLKGNTYLSNVQTVGQTADVKAAMSVEADWVGEKVKLNTQAIGNSASVSVKGAHFVNIHNTQTTGWQAPRPTDPIATTFVSIGEAPKIESATQAVSNAFTLETKAAEVNLASVQHNNSLTTSVANFDIGYADVLKASSVAIGNQLSIAPISVR